MFLYPTCLFSGGMQEGFSFLVNYNKEMPDRIVIKELLQARAYCTDACLRPSGYTF
jgi:hypothetical protein